MAIFHSYVGLPEGKSQFLLDNEFSWNPHNPNSWFKGGLRKIHENWHQNIAIIAIIKFEFPIFQTSPEISHLFSWIHAPRPPLAMTTRPSKSDEAQNRPLFAPLEPSRQHGDPWNSLVKTCWNHLKPKLCPKGNGYLGVCHWNFGDI